MAISNAGSNNINNFIVNELDPYPDDDPSDSDLGDGLSPSPDEIELDPIESDLALLAEDFAEYAREKMAAAHAVKMGLPVVDALPSLMGETATLVDSTNVEKTLEAKLRELSASGDDRTLSTHGNRTYWYSVGDGYRLLLAIRKTFTYTNTVADGEEYSAHRENRNRVLITDPYHIDNFDSCLEDDIKKIHGLHEIAASNRQWTQLPRIIIIPVLTGLHWRCLRLEMDYVNKKINILFDDPYGKDRFEETIKTRLKTSLLRNLDRLFTQTKAIELEELDKVINQQGVGNGYDCGPIVFSNITDYADVHKNNRMLLRGEGLRITSAEDTQHDSLMISIRTAHIAEYASISGVEIDEAHVDAIKQLMHAENQAKLDRMRGNKIGEHLLQQISQLPAADVERIFYAVEVLGLTVNVAYESIEAEYLGKPLFPIPAPSVPLLHATTLPTAQALVKEESANTEYQSSQDKVADIKILFDLSKQLTSFLKRGNSADVITQEDIRFLLIRVAQDFSTLKWKNKSDQNIRNLYGKINYKTGIENTEYIDFERLSLSYNFLVPLIQTNIAEISHKQIYPFLNDITLLFNNLLVVLHKELTPTEENPRLYIIKECSEIKQYVEERIPSVPPKLSPLNYLLPLIDIHYDPIFLRQMCPSVFLETLAKIDNVNDDIKWRYTVARILTIIGEAANNLSDSFKDRYCYLPFTTMIKLRDQLAHAHHQYIAKHNIDTMQFLSNVINELTSLQPVLAFILTTLPNIDDPQMALKVIDRHSIPIDELMPDELKSEVAKPFPIDLLVRLRSNEMDLLCAARILWIEKRLKSVNLHVIVDQSEQQYQSTIINLEAKSKLNSKQERVLTAAKKKLEELNNRKAIEGLDDELIRIRLLPSFNELLQHFKNKKLNDTDQKTKGSNPLLNSQVYSLIQEIDRLKSLYTSHLLPERNYATEHSIAIIGQLSKDLSESKAQLLKQIFQENRTIQQTISHNASARNQKVMHDPFNDHTPYLSSLILNETLPLAPDIKALKVVLDAKTPLEIATNTLFSIVQTYAEIGCSYIRLNLLNEAESYFTMSLSYTTPEHFANLHLQNSGWDTTTRPISESVTRSGASYVVQQDGAVVIAIDDINWISCRVDALLNLGLCQIRQEKSKLAIQHLQEALEIYSAYHAHDPILLAQIQACLYIATLKNNEKQEISLSQLNPLAEVAYDSYVNVLLQQAYIKYDADQFEDGLNIIGNIDLDKVSDCTLIINFSIIDGLLSAGIADEYEQKLAIKHNKSIEVIICPQSFEARDFAIAALTFAFNTFQTNRGQFRLASGNYIRCLEEDITRNLPIIMGSQAAKCLHHPDPVRLEAGYKLIKETLTRQTTFKQDTSISYSTLGSLCEKMYAHTADTQYLEEGLTAYTENTHHSDIRTRAIAYAGKASILFVLMRVHEAIRNSLDSLFYYSHLEDNKKNIADHQDIAHLKSEIKKAVQINIGVHIQVLNEYLEAGDAYQENGKLFEAIARYEKCLLGLEYVTNVPLKQKIEAKLKMCQTIAHST